MKTIEQWQKFFKELNINNEKLQIILDKTLDEITFLDNIYMTGGLMHKFSDNFHNAAYTERQAMCQKSSALYNLLRKN